MQKPQESLDDFLRPIEPLPAAPPSTVSLRPTGEVEVLSPLPLDQPHAKTANGLLLQHGAPRISWFHRSLIFGGGAVAAVAIIFLSALFIAVNEPAERASVEGIETPTYESDAPIETRLETADQPPALDVPTYEVESQVFGELRADPRPIVRSHQHTPRIQRAAFIPRRNPAAAQAPAFVPTTLVIYPENGEIKTRIEPSLSASFRIPATFSN